MSFLKQLKAKLTGKKENSEAASISSANPEANSQNGLACLERANQLSAHGQLQAALREFDKAIAFLPVGREKVAAYFNRGTVYRDLKHWDAAFADYDQVSKLAPTFGLVYLERGLCLSMQGHSEAAIVDYDKAIALLDNSPEKAMAYHNRGGSYATLGNFTAAIADYSQAIAVAPSFAGARQELAQLQEKMKNLGVASGQPDAVDATKTAEQQFEQGCACRNQNDLINALVHFDRAIALNPKHAFAYYNRGIVNSILRRYEQALADEHQALVLQPRFPAALTERGLVYQYKGNINDALVDYNAALALDPAYALAHANKGFAYAELEQWVDALACFNVAIRLASTNADFYGNRGEVLTKIGHYQRALADFTRFLQLAPQSPKAQPIRDRIEELSGKIGSGVDNSLTWSVRDELWPEFVVLTLQHTVHQLVQAVQTAKAYYVVVDLPTGQRSAVSVYADTGLRDRLTTIADLIGPDILTLKLEQLPDLWQPCNTITPSVSQGEAILNAERCGGQAFVMEDGQLLGIFATRHEYHYPGHATVLFGPEYVWGREGVLPSMDSIGRCHRCGAVFAYYKPDLYNNQLLDCICPSCGASPIEQWVEARMYPGRISRVGFLGENEHLGEVIAQDAQTLQALGITYAQIGDALDRLLDAATNAYASQVTETTQAFLAQMEASHTHACDGEAILPLLPTLDEIEEKLKQGELPPADSGVCVEDHQIFLKIYLGYQYCPWTILCRPWSFGMPPLPIRIAQSGQAVHHHAVTGRALPCHPGLDYRYGDRDFLLFNRKTGQYWRGAGLLVHLIREHHFFEGKGSPYRIEPEHAARVLNLL